MTEVTETEERSILEETLSPKLKSVARLHYEAFRKGGLTDRQALIAMELLSIAIIDFVPDNYKPRKSEVA